LAKSPQAKTFPSDVRARKEKDPALMAIMLVPVEFVGAWGSDQVFTDPSVASAILRAVLEAIAVTFDKFKLTDPA